MLVRWSINILCLPEVLVDFLKCRVTVKPLLSKITMDYMEHNPYTCTCISRGGYGLRLYGSWIYIYKYNQYRSLELVWYLSMVRSTWYKIMSKFVSDIWKLGSFLWVLCNRNIVNTTIIMITVPNEISQVMLLYLI